MEHLVPAKVVALPAIVETKREEPLAIQISRVLVVNAALFLAGKYAASAFDKFVASRAAGTQLTNNIIDLKDPHV